VAEDALRRDQVVASDDLKSGGNGPAQARHRSIVRSDQLIECDIRSRGSHVTRRSPRARSTQSGQDFGASVHAPIRRRRRPFVHARDPCFSGAFSQVGRCGAGL
jgi:hypothetical protein